MGLHHAEAALARDELAVSAGAVALAPLGALGHSAALARPHAWLASVAAGAGDLGVVAAVVFDLLGDVEAGDAEEVVLGEHRDGPPARGGGGYEVLAALAAGRVRPPGEGA